MAAPSAQAREEALFEASKIYDIRSLSTFPEQDTFTFESDLNGRGMTAFSLNSQESNRIRSRAGTSSLLSSDVIDFVMAAIEKATRNTLVKKNRRTFFVPSHVATAILNRRDRQSLIDKDMRPSDRARRLGRKKISLDDFDEILIPVFNSGHWSLIHVILGTGTITYYDSLGGDRIPDVVVSSVFRNVIDWISSEKQQPLTFSLPSSATGPLQSDSDNCGVLVLANASAIVHGKKPERVMASEVQVRKIRENMLYFAGKLHSEHIGSTKANAIDLTGEDIIDLTGDDAVHTNRLIPALDSDLAITAEMREALRGLEEASPLFSVTDRDALRGLDEGQNIDRAALDLGLLAINYRNEILRSRKERVPAVVCLGTEFYTSDISKYAADHRAIIIPLLISARWHTAVIDTKEAIMIIVGLPGVQVDDRVAEFHIQKVKDWILKGTTWSELRNVRGGTAELDEVMKGKANKQRFSEIARQAAAEAAQQRRAAQSSQSTGDRRFMVFQSQLYEKKSWGRLVEYAGNEKVEPFDSGAYMLLVASLVADGRASLPSDIPKEPSIPLNKIGFRNIKKVQQNILVSYVMMAVRDLSSYGRITKEQKREAEEALACLKSLVVPDPAMILHDDFQNLQRQVETVLDELHLETTKAIVLPRFIAAADAQEAARVEAEKREAEARADADRRRREAARAAAEKREAEARAAAAEKRRKEAEGKPRRIEFQQRDMGGSGDCLFRAVVDQLHVNKTIWPSNATTESENYVKEEFINRISNRESPFQRTDSDLQFAAHALRSAVTKFQEENPGLFVGEENLAKQRVPTSPEVLDDSAGRTRIERLLGRRRTLEEELGRRMETALGKTADQQTKEYIRALFGCELKSRWFREVLGQVFVRLAQDERMEVKLGDVWFTKEETDPKSPNRGFKEFFNGGICAERFMEMAKIEVQVNTVETVPISIEIQRGTGWNETAFKQLKEAFEAYADVDGAHYYPEEEFKIVRREKQLVTTGSEEGKVIVKKMELKSTYGGETEIAALSRILGVDIVVMTRGSGQIQTYLPSTLDKSGRGERKFGKAKTDYQGTGDAPRILLVNYDGTHYVSTDYKHSRQDDKDLLNRKIRESQQEG